MICFGTVLTERGERMSEWIVEITDGVPHTRKMTPLVRCKECENWDTEWQPVFGKSNIVMHYCPMIDRVTAEDMFCAYGKRKTVADIG